MRPLTMITCLTVLFYGAVGAAQESLPDSVKHIEVFADDPDALIDAGLRFQRQQSKLVDWDIGLAKQHANNKEHPLARTKAEMVKERIDVVRIVWEYVLSKYPNNPRALNYFGEFWYDIAGEEMKALTYWKRASMLDKQFGLADNNLGVYYFHMGNYRQGLNYLNKALEVDDKNPDYLFNMAQMYLNHFPDIGRMLDRDKKKLYKDAMKFSRDAKKYAPKDFDLAQDYAVNFFAAENFDIEVDWKEAASAWAEARTLAPTTKERYYTLLNEARCLLRANRNESAVPLLEEALEMMPDSDVVQNLLADARGQ